MADFSVNQFKGLVQTHGTGATFQLDKDQAGTKSLNVDGNKSLGHRFATWMRDIGLLRTQNPAMVAFKESLKADMGNEQITSNLFDKLNLGSHKPLTARRIEQATAYFESVKAAKNDGMFKHMGQEKFINYLFAADKAVAKNNFDTHGMTALEKVAVYGYTSNDYTEINSALRSSKPIDPNLQSYIDHAKNGLAKLPDDPGMTSRGVWSFPGIDNIYKQGATVTEKAFLSTAAGSGFNGDWQFQIQGQHGKDVSGMSMFPHEKEVLFPPGTQFNVVSVNSSFGENLVVLKEV